MIHIVGQTKKPIADTHKGLVCVEHAIMQWLHMVGTFKVSLHWQITSTLVHFLCHEARSMSYDTLTLLIIKCNTVGAHYIPTHAIRGLRNK